MRTRTAVLLLLAIFAVAAGLAQNQAPGAPVLTDPNATPVTSPNVRAVPASEPNAEAYTLPAGTHVALSLKHSITTRTARDNDPVYAETSFPVVSNGHVVIPVGTYVQGVVQRSQRSGHVKGKAELVLHFNTLIFPSGYTLLLPGALDSAPGSENAKMKDSREGTLESADGKTSAKDVGTVITTTGAGAGIGAVAAQSGRGALTGAGVGAGVGLASIFLRRGPDVRLEQGTTVDMVLEREITVEHTRTGDTEEPRRMRIVR